ncbi:hypothetical protein JHE00_11390 [Prauserella sp. ASG 168]|uniref:Uncharacterized protein n=1 Tax=Prauserella cavernicola TaxID=2800127 RepID=A0A934V594_9PSEU|nr:hypothetical protein [Prauserella cavernicola]
MAVFAAPAVAQDEEGLTSPEVTTSTSAEPTDDAEEPTTEPSEPGDEPAPSDPSDEPSPTTDPEPEPEDPGTSEPDEPTTPPTSDTDEPSEPELPPFEDNAGYGFDIDPETGLGMLIIACVAGEPTGLTSPHFDVLEGPWQDEVDGRYWGYMVQLRDGMTFESGNVLGEWVCGGDDTDHGDGGTDNGDGGTIGGGSTPIAPVPGAADAGSWQSDNGGDAQVGFAPKGGVETGAGGARG